MEQFAYKKQRDIEKVCIIFNEIEFMYIRPHSGYRKKPNCMI